MARGESEEPVVATPDSEESDGPVPEVTDGGGGQDDDDEAPVQRSQPRKRKQLRTIADDDDDEDEEQYLRDFRCACGDAAEAEHRGDDRDNEENCSVSKHGASHRWIAGLK